MKHMQREMLAIGKTGCYFLSIIHIASTIFTTRERGVFDVDYVDSTIQVLKLFRDGIERGWCDKECFMIRPDEMLKALVADAKSVSVKHAPLDYKPKENEYEITRYEKGSWAHFVCTKGGKITYDPYGYDEKDLGKPVSKRIFTVLFN